jgi:hypothetical protein
MGAAWVNRIGIILTFLAGFMVAPELISIERINKFEDSLEKRMDRFRAWANRMFPGGTKLPLLWLFAFLGGYIYTFYFWFHSPVPLWVHAVSASFFTAIVFLMALIVNRRNRQLLAFALLSVPITFLVCPLLILYYITLDLLDRSFERLSKRLEGDERLKSILVALGIVFFITGNFLQLVSTFLPSN